MGNCCPGGTSGQTLGDTNNNTASSNTNDNSRQARGKQTAEEKRLKMLEAAQKRQEQNEKRGVQDGKGQLAARVKQQRSSSSSNVGTNEPLPLNVCF